MSKPKLRCWKCNVALALKDVKWLDKKGDMYAYCKECED